MAKLRNLLLHNDDEKLSVNYLRRALYIQFYSDAHSSDDDNSGKSITTQGDIEDNKPEIYKRIKFSFLHSRVPI